MTPLDICLLQWDTYNKRMQKVLETIPEENYHKPIVAGGNSPSWILGHLADDDDALRPLLGIGDRLNPELAKIYHHERGSNQEGHLTKQELMKRWQSIVTTLDEAFRKWSESEWMSRHTKVSEEDFKKQPHRNKLNVMLSRVEHKASHLGQIAMMK